VIAHCADVAAGGGSVEIGYSDTGMGAPVVFLHGFPHNRSLWAPQVTAFFPFARCIAPDLRGFGESPARPPYGMDRYADDVASLLDALGVARAVIAGVSMGGYVAFAFWRRHRERVRALLLADTRPGPDDEAARGRRRDLIAAARKGGSPAVADRMIEGMIGRRTRARSPGLVGAVHSMLAAAPVEGTIGALEAMIARPDSTPDLATIDVPTLVVVGEDDVLTPVAESRAMHAAIGGSRLEVIAGAGHLPNLERPAAFNQVTGEFILALRAP
jgi:pimeloyl-ACP methyl ester carboxylesterase